jgi:hypothetical protein
MRNYQLGRQVVTKAEHDPEHFSMSTWASPAYGACGMTACLGGWAMILAGYSYVIDCNDEILFYRPDGSLVHGGYADEVEELLGFTPAERKDLGSFGGEVWFDTKHGLERFRAMVEASERETALS